MSTSSSTSPPPSPLGECVVCGKESSTRCSSCAKGGVDWMYFCSTMHQRVIWSVHKRVCGGRFRWPAFTPEEEEEMIELSTLQTRGGFEGGLTWLEGFTQWLKESGELSEGEDPRKVFKDYMMQIGGPDECLQTDQEMLLDFRSKAFKIRAGSGRFLSEEHTFQDFRKLATDNPLGYLAWTLQRCPEPSKTHWETKWYSDLRHRALNIVAIVLAFDRSVTSPMDNIWIDIEYLAQAVDKVKDLARNSIYPTEPKFAKFILDVYLRDLLATLGTTLDPEAFKWDLENLSERWV